MPPKKNKYMWTAEEFNMWCKKQAQDLRPIGLNSTTAGVTRLLYSKFIVPNNINMRELIKSEINIKRKRK